MTRRGLRAPERVSLPGMWNRRLLCAALSVLLLACASETEEKQNEAFWPTCDETRTAVGLDDETPLGITPREAFERATGNYLAELKWKNGDKTVLTVAFTSEVTEVEFVDRTPNYGTGEGPGIAIECPDTLETKVDLTFATADGAFDESFRDVLLHWEKEADGARLRAHHALDLTSLSGTYEPNELDPSEYDRIVQPRIEFTIGEDGAFSGSIVYIAEKHHGSGPEGSVSATPVTAASW